VRAHLHRLAFAYPQLAQTIIDDVTHGGRTNFLWPAIGLVAAFLFRDLFNSVRILVNNVFEQNVIYDIRRDVFSRVQRLPSDTSTSALPAI